MTIGWGVIGCGWVARDYGIPAIREAESAHLAGLYDPNPDACAGIDAPRFGSIDALLADPAIDAVYIATPNHCHAAQVEAAAAAGKAILCEKPMGCTAEDIRGIERAITEAGVPYATAYDQRHHEAHAQLKDWLTKNKIGRVTQARIHYACWLHRDWHPDNWRIDRTRAGGGACIDLAPHGIDLLSFLLDEEPDRLQLMLQSRLQDYPVDDGAVLTLGFPSGVLASLHVAYNCPDHLPRRRLELIGEHGSVVATDTMGQVPGGTLHRFGSIDEEPETIRFTHDQSPFTRQIEQFSRHLLHGAPLAGSLARDVRLSLLLRDALDATGTPTRKAAHAA